MCSLLIEAAPTELQETAVSYHHKVSRIKTKKIDTNETQNKYLGFQEGGGGITFVATKTKCTSVLPASRFFMQYNRTKKKVYSKRKKASTSPFMDDTHQSHAEMYIIIIHRSACNKTSN